MRHKLQLQSVADDELLRRLTELLRSSRRVESELITHLAEVDHRRLYARHASSLFRYCTEILHLSEQEAYLRIEVARASRKHPVLLEMLGDGRLHLSGIAVLHRHLTEANRENLLKRAAHKSKRQVEELVAELDPKPDVPATMRKLPQKQTCSGPTPSGKAGLGPDLVAAPPTISETEPSIEASVTERPAPPPSRPAEVKPLSPARYKVSFTASAELHDKLERLQALISASGNPADLAAVIDAAVTEKLEKLESKRYGRTKTPRKSLESSDTSPSSRRIPAAVRRAVFERDGGRCSFQDGAGRRCTETRRLEYHHIRPYGRGGDHRADNIALRCRAHNLHDAECEYGKAVLDKYRRSGGRVSELGAFYTFSNRATSLHGVAPALPP